MSRQEKRFRGKRPRYEAGTSREPPLVQGFSPVNYPPQPGPPFTRHPESTQSSQRTALHAQLPDAVPGQEQQGLSITTQVPPGKVAIPALRTPRTADSSKSFKKGRTPHACDYCRKAKAGCTGGHPCSRCRNAGAECVYGDGKRVRDRKRMSKLSKVTDSLTKHNADVTDALRRIRVDIHLSQDDMRAALDHILAMAPSLVILNEKEDDRHDLSASERASADPEAQDDSEQSFSDAEMGSTGSLDVINVDIDRDDARATGHIGKSSSVAWAKRTAEECEQTTLQETTVGKHDRGFTLASYHAEDADVEYFDTSNVDPYGWPEPEMAERLIQSYFDHAHDALPIIDKADFMSKYKEYIRGSNNLAFEDTVWLATVNTVFAISSVYFHLCKTHDRGTHQDHMIYCTRARMLCLDEGLLYQDARMSTTGALGLMCLYFITTCRLNRAWIFCGLAIRNALTLGLNVRSEAQELSDVEKEHRVRVWWSLYSLECMLNELTGRPSCISNQDISTPLPLNMEEDEFRSGQALYHKTEETPKSRSSSRRGSRVSKSRPSPSYKMRTGISQPLADNFPIVSLPITSSTYFIYRTQLSIISHEIITQLYCASTIKERWPDVQNTIHRIDQRLLAWRDKITSEVDITFGDTWTQPDWKDPLILPRLGLAMQFASSRMILFRPCLCRFEGRLKAQSEKSQDFTQDAVEKCIHQARKMIRLLSWAASSPTDEKLHAIAPWWSTLHYICEALSVLMLEMAFKAAHMPEQAADILVDAKKGVLWLSKMSGASVSARKAWEIFDSLIRLVAPMINWSVFDMPIEAPIPPGYNWRRFSAAPFSSLPAPPQQQHQQLSESNLQEYSATMQASTLPTNVTTWQQPSQTFGFSEYSQPFEAANPLDHITAMERFSNMRQIHSHYDDPWQHFFPFTQPESSLDISAPNMDIMQGQMGGETGMGQERPYPDPPEYGINSGSGSMFSAYRANSMYNAAFGPGEGSSSGHGGSSGLAREFF